MIELICPECGTPFEKTHWRKIYCSFPCQNRVKARNWRAKNPEQQKALERRNRLKHRDVINERQRAWHHSNKERQNEKRMVHYRANQEHADARRKAYYYAHHDEQKENQKVRTQIARVTVPWEVSVDRAKRRAQKYGVPFDLTNDWAKARWTGFCEVSGLPFRVGLRGNGPKIFSPSVDQIIPKAGYTMDNCRFVIWAVNALKHDGTDEDMIAVATAVAERANLIRVTFPPVGTQKPSKTIAAQIEPNRA